MQDLNDMLYFAEVVERGGFAAAGRALGIPKSRLSRRVSELEAQLGVRLLQRTTRKLSLTDVGEAFLRHCQAVRESALAARDTVAQVQTEPRGTIRVSCPVTLAQTKETDALGRVTSHTFDARGNPIGAKLPDGSELDLVWDEHDRLQLLGCCLTPDDASVIAGVASAWFEPVTAPVLSFWNKVTGQIGRAHV